VKRPARDWNMIVANMYERWGVSATDEAQAITSYLAAQFGRNLTNATAAAHAAAFAFFSRDRGSRNQGVPRGTGRLFAP
jgi:hypothetical protein